MKRDGQLVDNFKRLATENNLSHAYLFFGGDKRNKERKSLFAESLANFLENGVFEASVRLLKETLIISPDEKGTVGIESIRTLKYFLWQKPINSSRRTAIIKEAQALTPEAQNAALKIVEEPPESALIIFIADSEDSLFPALNSRFQKIYFPCSLAVDREEEINIESIKGLDESLLDEAELNRFFENLINDLKREPVKNSRQLKQTLSRLTLIKQFNTNKRLQLKALISLMSDNR